MKIVARIMVSVSIWSLTRFSCLSIMVRMTVMKLATLSPLLVSNLMVTARITRKLIIIIRLPSQ